MKLTYLLVIIVLISLAGSSRLFARLKSLPSWRLFFTTSTLFLFTGILIGPHGINLISQTTLVELKPVTELLMGWVGMVLGLQLRWHHLRRTPWRIAVGSQIQAVVSLLVILLGFVLFQRIYPDLFAPFSHWRMFAMLAAIGLSTAPEIIQVSGLTLIRNKHSFRTALFFANFGRITSIVAVGILYTVFRPATGLLHLPALHWIGLTLVLGILMGFATTFFSYHSEDEAGFLATITGIIIFAAGLAYYLQLSPLLLALVIGIVTANSSSQASRLFTLLSHYDQPVFMLLLILAGALLNIPISGLVPLLLVYLTLRILGKVAGNRLANTLLPQHCRSTDRFMLPQGALTLALAVHQFQTYGDSTAAAVFQLLLLGAIFFSYLAPHLLGGWRR